MSPSGLDLSVLRAVLTDHAVRVDPTSDVGAGVALAGVSLAPYDFAVAVIPADYERHEASLPAIYIEIGVAVASGLPLIIIAGTAIPAVPALAGAAVIVMTELGNEEALRLHLGVFVRQMRAAPRADQPACLPALPAPSLPAAYLMRLQAVREAPGGLRGAEFERLVGDLLREAGAQAEDRSPWDPDGGADIAAFIPGEEQRLGAVVIQVKSGTLTSHALRQTQHELSTYVLQAGARLGLLVYDQIAPGASKVPPAPQVFSLGIDQLLAELETKPLSTVLTQARNRAVHGV
jgi:Restriction endonuclease